MDHFDRMYVCVCQFSTTPRGLFQMTGRVRSLRDPVVQCVVQRGVSLDTPKHRKVTVDEQRKFMEWLDEEMGGRMPSEAVRGEGGDVFVLPLQGPLLQVWAHNDARRINAQHRFFMEFKDLVTGEGHRVIVAEDEAAPIRPAPDEPEPQPGYKAARLLETRDLTDEEFDAVHARVCQSDASEDDKWEDYRYIYMASWGVDRLDTGFVEANGTQTGSKSVHMCMRLLFPSTALKPYAALRESCQVLQAGLIQQTLDALGFHHPFNIVATISTDDARAAVLRTDMFRNYNQNICVFDTLAKRNKTWRTVKDLTNTLQTILAPAGIKLVSSSKQLRVHGKQKRVYAYSIDPEQARHVASLVNLKLRANPKESTCRQAQQFLGSVGFGQWAHLVDTESSPRSNVTFLDDD